MEEIHKEVYFDKYCRLCESRDVEEYEDPCNDCLGEPVNVYSNKPVNWKEKKKK